MAAREPRWYVYVLKDVLDLVIYVGKGCGKRSQISQRRRGGTVSIVKRFLREAEALRYEKRLIKECRPPLNLTAGGEGHSRTRRRGEISEEVRVRRLLRKAETDAQRNPSLLNLLAVAAYRQCQENQATDP